MDVVGTTVLKKYMNTKFSEMNNALTQIKGLVYKEYDFTINLTDSQTLMTDIDIAVDALLITTMYIKGTGNFDFRIYDKAVDGFKLYDASRITDYSDSIFLLYNDKDNLQKLHVEAKNNTYASNTITVKILGLEVKK